MSSKHGNGSTTIGALKGELKSFLDTLEQTKTGLNAEIQKMQSDAAGLRKEYDAGAKSFARNTLTELDGAAFDEVAALAQSVAELTGQGLAFTRQSLRDNRNTALETVNRSLTETVDAASYPAALAAAEKSRDATKAQAEKADQAYSAAARELKKWTDSPESTLLQLDNSLRASGKRGIAPENKDYYDTESLWEAIKRDVRHTYIEGDKTYRQVRRALIEYKQGGSRDAFADVDQFKQTGAQHAAAADAAKQAKDTANGPYAAAQALYKTLDDKSADILTDAQILGAVQDKLAGYLSTPQFMKAAADKYGEDFPSSLPQLAAKLKTLDNLRTEAQKNLGKLNDDIKTAKKSYENIKDADTSRHIPVDLDKLKKDNARYQKDYTTYTSNANQSRQHAHDDNNLTAVWTILLADQMLNHGKAGPGPLSLPNLGSVTPSGNAGSMDLNDATSSPFKLDISLNKIFEDVARDNGTIDLSPPPAPVHHNSNSGMSSGGSISFDNDDNSSSNSNSGGGMNSGGSMDL